MFPRTSSALPSRRRRTLLVRAMLTAAFAVASPSSFAQSYPDRAVRLIVPAPAGGPTDILARVIGEKLSMRWQQPVVIENKPGATQTLGTAYVARSAPDGYTLLMLLDATVTMLPAAMTNLPYNRMSLTPVMTLVNVPGVLATGRNMQTGTLPDLIRSAKTAPGELSIGFGTFSLQVLATQLGIQTGVQFNQVPYKGGPDLAQGLLRGELSLGLGSYFDFRQGSKLRFLAVTGDQRSPGLPDVPTFAELGYPGMGSGTWIGIAAPAGTPQAIVDHVYVEASKVMAMPDVQQRLKTMDIELFVKNPADTARLIAEEYERWGKVIRDAKLELN